MTGNESLKVALVTGAGSGIGRAVSFTLAEMGYTVVLAGRRAAPIEEVQAQLKRSGREALAVPTDVAKHSSTSELFGRIRSKYGRLDLLFNNAGINARPIPLEELTVEEWQSVLATNLTGAFFCIQEAFRIMKAQRPNGGRIINNGSISAHVPRPLSAVYTASKHAISGLTKAVALEGRPYGIACGQIDIGNAATAIGSHVIDGALQANGSRVVEPTLDISHVTEAVRYMASLPLEANVLQLTVMPTGMPFIGRG